MKENAMPHQIMAGCYQFHVQPGEVDRNLRQLESALPWFTEQRCQLLVLPEMWSGGFAYDRLAALAERTPEVLAALQQWSLKYCLVTVGSLPEAVGATICNTAYVIDSNGAIAGAYRKIHLFSLHREDLHFGRGSQPMVCDTQLGRIGVMICYDLRFPELARRLALDGAEIICVPALWPVPRIDHWSLLLRARAVENQLFVVGCNGWGAEGKLVYGGKSALVSPLGRLLAEADDQESRLAAAFDKQEMAEFRTRIPCFADRLPDVYGNPP
jgi:predicted amidohydrolase